MAYLSIGIDPPGGVYSSIIVTGCEWSQIVRPPKSPIRLKPDPPKSPTAQNVTPQSTFFPPKKSPTKIFHPKNMDYIKQWNSSWITMKSIHYSINGTKERTVMSPRPNLYTSRFSRVSVASNVIPRKLTKIALNQRNAHTNSRRTRCFHGVL